MDVKSRDDVAVFVDFENVYVSVREKFDATPNFELIMDRCEDYGRVVMARAYADWYRYPRVTSALFANGVEPMYVPTYYYDREAGRTGRPIKNSVDIHLCIDAMRTLYSQPNILKYVLVTGDRDFIPLVNAIRQLGKDVIVIGIGGAASAHLAQSCDEFLFYEQIADLKAPGQPRTQAVPAPQPQPQQPQPQIEAARVPEGRDGRGRDRRGGRGEHAEPVQPDEVFEQPKIAVPESTEPVEAAARSPYDTLAEAIQLARRRGFVANLGSLKVLMRELDSTFNEAKVKDNNGKGFVKFKDFVKEAENRGKVQIFTNGTVTEVFLPGEDPYRMSQFAEDLTSDRVETELEHELDDEQQAKAKEVAPPVPEPVAAAQHAAPEPVAVEVMPAAAQQPDPVAEDAQEAVATAEVERRTFTERDWNVFRSAIAEFSEPVRFANIFNALRGLRNQEVVELTNNELKELVKQAINSGMLHRTGRGAKAYYRLNSQYRPASDTDSAATTTADVPTDVQPTTEAQRRARSYGLPSGELTAAPAAAEQSPAAVQVSEAVLAAPAVVGGEEPAAAPKRRSRRKKSAPQEETTAAAGGTDDVTKAAPAAAPRQPQGRQRPAAAAVTANGNGGPPAEEQPAAKRRRRRKPADANGETQG
ncbi:MAG: hypothetical protein NVSMB42_22040 [Herpetosiphon sp.]